MGVERADYRCECRVTVMVLQINRADRVEVRQLLASIDLYP